MADMRKVLLTMFVTLECVAEWPDCEVEPRQVEGSSR
jgi:hypothetical protein